MTDMALMQIAQDIVCPMTIVQTMIVLITWSVQHQIREERNNTWEKKNQNDGK